ASPTPSPALLQQDPGIRALLEGVVGYSHTVVYAAVVDPADRILVHSNPKLAGETLPPRESLERLKTRSTLAIVAALFGEPEVYGATVELTRDDELGELAARVNQLGERVHADQSHWQNDRARMEGILDSLEDAMVVLNPEREVVFCNQAAEGLLGQSLDSGEGGLAGLLPPDHPLAPVVTELFDASIERRNAAVKVRCPDGQSRELAVSSYRIPDGERAGGGVLALRNLEPVRAVHSLVTYSQKLAALGRLTSGVAHEVKNPLNAMRIHLELLKARLGAGQPAVRENLDVIAQEIVRLDRVVQGFLKFVRPEDVRLARVDVN